VDHAASKTVEPDCRLWQRLESQTRVTDYFIEKSYYTSTLSQEQCLLCARLK
jgi:hypothetical protein